MSDESVKSSSSTRRKRNTRPRSTAATLRECEQRSHALFDRHPLAMLVREAKSERFLAVNDAALEQYGYAREEFLAMTMSDIRPAEEARDVRGITERLAPGRHVFPGLRHRKKDGTVLVVDAVAHDVVWDGRPAWLLTVVKSMSEFLLEDLAPQPSPTGGGVTILVVDDEEAVRSSTRRALERAGYDVILATDGSDALRLFTEHNGRIRMVISDIVMPGLGGRELVGQLKVMSPALPVLFISGYTEEAVRDQDVLEPGAAYLAKPYTPAKLLRKVLEVLGS